MASILITGGAGFIGTNAAHHFASRGWTVNIVDNLSRRGTEKNLAWVSDGVCDLIRWVRENRDLFDFLKA